MPSLVHQIGELFLRAVPVAVIVLIFYIILKTIFFKPLLIVMAEREARTIGAQKEAEAAQAKAAEKVRQYEEALRHARAKVYTEQEAARKKFMDERAAILKDARAKANEEVATAKGRIKAEFEAAKKEVETSVPQLATEIAGRVLHAPEMPSSPREAR
ncbi:MAG TPA: ATP synthase F0 subunit B [Candidatus Acidoferrum sp.]